MKKKELKILLFDVECSPSLGFFYDMYKEGNILEVVTQSYMLSFAYKWFGEAKVSVRALPDFKGYEKDKTSDEALVKELSQVLEQAEVIVAHNGDSFDLKYTNTRLVSHCLTPISPKKTVDTLKLARGKFRFLSNRLDDLGNVLGIGRKVPHTGKKLWLDCMNGNPQAWRTMRAYNAQDVVLLERVYKRLRPFATNHPNIGFITRRPDACPKCGSTHLQARGYQYTRTSASKKYQCMSCFGWCTGVREKLGIPIRTT